MKNPSSWFKIVFFLVLFLFCSHTFAYSGEILYSTGTYTGIDYGNIDTIGMVLEDIRVYLMFIAYMLFTALFFVYAKWLIF